MPKETVEDAVTDSIKEDSHNPLCTVSIDHKGEAVKHWQLNKESTTIIVDGSGKIIFVDEGVLDSDEQEKIITLLKEKGKPFDE